MSKFLVTNTMSIFISLLVTFFAYVMVKYQVMMHSPRCVVPHIIIRDQSTYIPPPECTNLFSLYGRFITIGICFLVFTLTYLLIKTQLSKIK